ncbi:16S rRNA (guanine527-N7)-methyltransferase [Salana multivorans]|uniref:Ribosomal RNA small subunit methyltransferase G n=1 Tax=Salana multivorans TaxID=120377 RepID=A0A3N2DA38_9MICO|nr:16S rRNA (guanine527-N7)-methyltransferase [Salana multivorans]
MSESVPEAGPEAGAAGSGGSGEPGELVESASGEVTVGSGSVGVGSTDAESTGVGSTDAESLVGVDPSVVLTDGLTDGLPSFVTDVERSREALGVGFPQCVRFGELLVAHGEERGLIGPRELPRLWTRHIVNSAAVARYLPATGLVADVGSGAGLPGIVLASMRPGLGFHLIEPMERRCAWLREVVDALGLDNVEVYQRQAQELHGSQQYVAVTARAVAALDKLLRWTWPLVEPGGALLAMKGQRAAEEVDAASAVLRKLKAGSVEVHEVDVLGDGDLTRVVEVHKKG